MNLNKAFSGSVKYDIQQQKLTDYRIKNNLCFKCGKSATKKVQEIFPYCDVCFDKFKKGLEETKIAVKRFQETGVGKK